MDQGPEFLKKFPQGIGTFVVNPIEPIPGITQEIPTSEKALLSREELRSIGRFGLSTKALQEHTGIIIFEEDDLEPIPGVESLDTESLIRLAGLAIYSPDTTFSHDVAPTPGLSAIEVINDDQISKLGSFTLNSAEISQFN